MSKLGTLSTVSAYLVRKLWTVCAIILVTFAIFVTLVRYSLPYANEQKHRIEAFVSAEYSVDLTIDNIDAKWHGNGPRLVLENVTLAQSQRSPLALSVINIDVEIDFWESLLSRQLVSKSFDLNGLALDIDIQQMDSPDRSFPIVDALENLFLEQLHMFSVTNSVVSISTQNTNESVNIERLSWINKDNRHQGQGRLQVAELENNSAYFLVDLHTNNQQLDGTIYARANELDISPWLNEVSALQTPLKEGRGNFELWASIVNNRIDGLSGILKPSTFTWSLDDAEHTASIEAGIFSVVPDGDKWQFGVNDLHLNVLGEHLHTDIAGEIDSQDKFSLEIKTPFNIAPILQLAGVLNPVSLTKLAQAYPIATLASFSMQFEQNKFRAYSELTDIAWQQNKSAPGVKGLNARLYFNDTRLATHIFGSSITLKADAAMSSDLRLKQLQVPLFLSFSDNSWELSANNLSVAFDDFNFNGQFVYSSDDNNLLANGVTSEFSTDKIIDYLPSKIMGEGATNFLKRAFNERGTITKSAILWQGSLNRFPFYENDGVFQAKVNIEQADFTFSSDWPKITQMDIDLDFLNNDLSMFAKQGKIEDVMLSEVSARIPLLSKGTDLVIEANAKASGKKLRDLMLKGSLRNTLGKTLDKDLVINEQVSANISLYVPLDTPQETSASGRVMLVDNQVDLPNLKLALEKVTGLVYFTNDRVRFSNLSANLFGQAISADYNSAFSDGLYRLDAIIEGTWDTKLSAKLLGEELQELVDGSFTWNGVINATLGKSEFDYAATLYSDLQASEVSLAAPLKKAKGELKHFRVVSNGNQQASNISASLDSLVNFEGILPHKEKRFSRAHLALGDTDFMALGVGFSVAANLPSIDLLDWYQTINAIVGSSKKTDQQNNHSIIPAPSRVFLEADKLLIANQSINDVNLRIKRQQYHWLVDADADELKATITLFDDWMQRGIDIDADFMRFNNYVSSESSASFDINPQSLPPIKLYCRQCEIAGNRLGELSLQTQANDDGMLLEKIAFTSQNAKFDANGQWYKRNNDHYTFITGDLDSSDFGGFLKDFKFDSGIKDSEADIEFNVTWKNSPMDFEFAHLDGNLDWQLSDGYLTELSDKGSRIFTLLSLESLVRKLSLDFRDVFAKGFFYDEMNGSVQITDGKADTRDTEIDGGAGDMSIYGYTDLVSRELNYNVSFTPKVTGNLPVLIYFMVNPPTAIAALALDQVLTSTKVISNVNYSITGTLDKPELLETGRQSTEVELPARRDIDETETPFIPPTIDDAVQIEIKDSE